MLKPECYPRLSIYTPEPQANLTQDEIDEYTATHEPTDVKYETEYVTEGYRDALYPTYNDNGSLFRGPTVSKYTFGREPIIVVKTWRFKRWIHPNGQTFAIKELVNAE